MHLIPLLRNRRVAHSLMDTLVRTTAAADERGRRDGTPGRRPRSRPPAGAPAGGRKSVRADPRGADLSGARLRENFFEVLLDDESRVADLTGTVFGPARPEDPSAEVPPFRPRTGRGRNVREAGGTTGSVRGVLVRWISR
ncbi:hypothetical protein Slala05_37060 [Streptomyces lavendulae subsp. lavendulae]|nr:hypothetical protein Slala05_37060 [Streptomyces lavendulae subsp. lavendulae]